MQEYFSPIDVADFNGSKFYSETAYGKIINSALIMLNKFHAHFFKHF